MATVEEVAYEKSCRKGKSTFPIDYAPGIYLQCTQCGNHNVEISRIFGVWCTYCRWYRNNQSGMLRGNR